jgi:outer membrane protein OmpA-like peptidoglycan-associated protein
MTGSRTVLFAFAFLFSGILWSQNGSNPTPVESSSWVSAVNSTANDYLIAPAKKGVVYFVSDRPETDHGTLQVEGCGKFKKPYSLYRAENGAVEPVRAKGTERWAGPPVFSPDGEWLALPVWNNQCVDGIAGIELVVYQKTTNKKADLNVEGTSWEIVRKVGQPAYKVTWHPAFHPTKPLLYFETEERTGPAKIRFIPLASGEPDPEVVPLPGTEDAVYPTFVNGKLHYSRPVENRGLDVFAWNNNEQTPVNQVNTAGNDFHWIEDGPGQTWISQRTADRGTDIVAHATPKPEEKKAATSPLPEPTATAAAKSPEPKTPTPTPAPVAAGGTKTWVAAGKFTNADYAQRRAEALTTNPSLASRVSVRYDGTTYSVVVAAEPSSEAPALLAAVLKVAPDAVLIKTPTASAQSVALEIYFDFDRSEIRPEEARRIQAYLASIKGQNGTFELTGHCDSRGSNAYNLQLGLRRAKSTKAYVESLRGAVVSDESSRSEWDLQDPCPDGVPCDENAHQRNRRVILVFEPAR